MTSILSGLTVILSLLVLFPSLPQAAERHHFSTEHFHFIYRKQHQPLLPRIIIGAETALLSLQEIFSYQPTEPITVVIQDHRDVGGGSATALPHNTVTLNIAPFDQGEYESGRFDDQFQWLFSHELVHIITADQASRSEKRLRSILGKVMPVKDSPLTLPFSLLTNKGRFTPTWYQEGIAVFMETWLNGGYGRVLGSYDEMYFRTLAYENTPGESWEDVDFNDDSFLLGSTAYLYGARFMTHLVLRYDLSALLDWVRLAPDQEHLHFQTKFQQVFGTDLETAWNQFLHAEEEFQHENLKRIRKYPLTPVQPLTEPLGWVTRAYKNTDHSVLLASLRPDKFTAIEQLNLADGQLKEIHTLITPSLIQVASTAFDQQQFFFFTTHNDRGYRDLWAVDMHTQESKRLFRDARIGSLTVNPRNRDLWGIQIRQARSVLVVSPFPYRKFIPLISLPMNSILGQLQIHPEGDSMLATLRRGSGEQEIILIDLEKLQKEKKLFYTVLARQGSPEHPDWGLDGDTVYWNAYTSGVSNIFRQQIGSNRVEILSNTLTGLFHPLVLDQERIFAYQFTGRGFQPVIIPDRPVEGLAAIRYRGQQVIENHPELREWRLKPAVPDPAGQQPYGEVYHGLLHLRKNTLIPVVASYGQQTAFGLYLEMQDPLSEHRLSLQSGWSQGPDSENNMHLSSTYAYRNTLEIGFQHLPTSFYDLANQRDVRRVNNGFFSEYKKFWIYDRPKTLEQTFSVGWNQWKYDDFGGESSEETFSVGTGFRLKNSRMSIGSVDDEKGYRLSGQVQKIHSVDAFDIDAAVLSGEVNWFTPLFLPHNIFRIQTATGKSWGDPLGESLFYFEGFGGQFLEEQTVRRYRLPENFTGLGENSQVADAYAKLTVENLFPSMKIGWRFGNSYVKRTDLVIFHQQLYTELENESARYWNIGMQNNWYLTNFYTVDATLSLGFAHAWDEFNNSYNEFFIYLKLFRN